MICWLAEKANLSDCHVPYLRLTEALVEPGRGVGRALVRRLHELAGGEENIIM